MCLDIWDDSLVIICWFYVKIAYFQHKTGGIFPVTRPFRGPCPTTRKWKFWNCTRRGGCIVESAAAAAASAAGDAGRISLCVCGPNAIATCAAYCTMSPRDTLDAGRVLYFTRDRCTPRLMLSAHCHRSHLTSPQLTPSQLSSLVARS